MEKEPPAGCTRFRVLISYRRQDSSTAARRIFDRLAVEFGRSNAFIDIDSIPLGVDFHDYVKDVLSGCGAVLSLIGPQWEGRRAPWRSRIWDSGDFVRLEIEQALRQRIPIFPVLLNGRSMPATLRLPKSMQDLTKRNAAFLSEDGRFAAGLDQIVAQLNSIQQTRADIFVGYMSSSHYVGDMLKAIIKRLTDMSILDRSSVIARTSGDETDQAITRCSAAIFVLTKDDIISYGSMLSRWKDRHRARRPLPQRDTVVEQARYFLDVKGSKRVMILIEEGVLIPKDLRMHPLTTLPYGRDLIPIEQELVYFFDRV